MYSEELVPQKGTTITQVRTAKVIVERKGGGLKYCWERDA